MKPAEAVVFDEPSIWKILLRIAPPVMLAQLIQAMYNIVDSFFVGRYSGDGLTALSIIFPVQLIITAISVGTGVGVNTLISRYYAQGKQEKAKKAAGTGTMLALITWLLFAVLSFVLMRPYVMTSAESPLAVEYAVTYGQIVCVGSFGIFLESIWTKVHQARGNMRLPMVAQILGAVTNIILDPILIFGLGPCPELGVAGAAYATVAGQIVAAVVTSSALQKPPCWRDILYFSKKIYRLGYPSIFMQLLFTVYIVALNVILAGFSDEAVTVLGLYYKIQSFFFIPLNGLQTCIVPLLSYTFAQKAYARCRDVLKDAVLLSMGLMFLGTLCFELIPGPMLSIFSAGDLVLEIGIPALRIIGLSFLPAVLSLMMPVFFQAIGSAIPSLLLSLTRQVFCLIPIFWLLSHLGLGYTWLAFPISESVTALVGIVLYIKQLKYWKLYTPKHEMRGVPNMKMITAIVNRKDSAEVCQALTEAGFYFTKTTSFGGFLSAGNVTLTIGTEDSKVADALSVIRNHCSRRMENVSASVPSSTPTVPYPTQVSVGGAIVFVTNVEQFEKM